MFIKDSDDIWYYGTVRLSELETFDNIGFAFENGEVVSMGYDMVERLDIYKYHDSYNMFKGREKVPEIFHIPSCEMIRVVLKKEVFNSTDHLNLDGMFSNDGEYREDLDIHFSSPDIVSVNLFDTTRKQRADIYVPWTGDSEYLNEAVTIEKDKETIVIEAMTNELREAQETNI